MASTSIHPSVSALPTGPDSPPTPSHLAKPDNLADDFSQALDDIRSKLPESLHSPKVALVCGSGLQGLAEQLVDPVLVPYADIAGFGESTGASERRLYSPPAVTLPLGSGLCFARPRRLTLVPLRPTVHGHKSALAFGFLGKTRVPVVCQLGRCVPSSGSRPLMPSSADPSGARVRDCRLSRARLELVMTDCAFSLSRFHAYEGHDMQSVVVRRRRPLGR